MEIKKKILDVILAIPFEKWGSDYVTKINGVEVYLRVDVSYPSGVFMIGGDIFLEEYKKETEEYYLGLKGFLENIKKKNIEFRLSKIYKIMKYKFT